MAVVASHTDLCRTPSEGSTLRPWTTECNLVLRSGVQWMLGAAFAFGRVWRKPDPRIEQQIRDSIGRREEWGSGLSSHTGFRGVSIKLVATSPGSESVFRCVVECGSFCFLFIHMLAAFSTLTSKLGSLKSVCVMFDAKGWSSESMLSAWERCPGLEMARKVEY